MVALLLLPGVASFARSGAPVRVVDAADPALVRRFGVLRWHDTAFSGDVVERDSTGAQSETEYRDGVRDGWARAWYPNGQLTYERQYRQGKEVGAHRGWWPDGREHFVYHYGDGLTEGTAREWFPSGQLYREFHYAAGHESGSERMWYADGRLRANYVVRDGRRFGLPGSKGCTGLDGLELASRESRVAKRVP